MNFYSIKDLEVYSGIKAHTIRIWEKRYNLLEPSRTESNIRYYDDRQLIKLLNIATLIESGWKISKVSRLDHQRLCSETEKCLQQYDDTVYSVPINGLIAAMFKFDEEGFRKIIESCFQRLSIPITIEEIIYPLLHRVGLMWRTEEISPAQEHFISNIIRQKIFVELDKLPIIPWNSDTGTLVFLPQDEYHEIGLLVTAYMLRKQRIPAIILGSNTPIAVVQHAVQQLHPKYFLTFLIIMRNPEDVQTYFDRLTFLFPDIRIGVACNPELLTGVNVPDQIVPLHRLEQLTGLYQEAVR